MRTPGCDECECECEQELGDVSALVDELPGPAELIGGTGDLDEDSGVQQLGDAGVAGDGHSEHDQPSRHGRSAGGRIGTGDDLM